MEDESVCDCRLNSTPVHVLNEEMIGNGSKNGDCANTGSALCTLSAQHCRLQVQGTHGGLRSQGNLQAAKAARAKERSTFLGYWIKCFRAFTCARTLQVEVCVCVSTPGQRVFHHHSFHAFQLPWTTTLYGQGATGSLHSCRQRSSMQMTRMQGLIIPVYLPPQLLTTLSNLPGLFPWFFMIPSP